MEAHAASPSRLALFPVTTFAMVMGLAGLAIAWSRAAAVLDVPAAPGRIVLYATVALFVVLVGIYGAKFAAHGEAVAKEFTHPVKLNFFPAISIAMILVATGFLHDYAALSRVLWTAGAVLHLVFTLYVISSWINHTRYEITHINPTWFIPVVGNILVPIAGVHHASSEISWFFFSIGLVFWLVLATIIYYRMFFHDPLPARLVPTLFILIAPPAVGFISYVALTGGVDAFARVLYYTALFLTLMLFTQVGRFYKVPFFISWWAYSFPMAAITIASMIMFEHTGLAAFKALSLGLLVVLTVLLLLLVFRTALGVARNEICVEE